jgi:hypothetical protein
MLHHRAMMALRSVAAAAAFAIALTATARAAVEFCPATASVPFPVGEAFGTPALRYAYELNAPTPRGVNATLVADTDKGWYRWSVSGVALTSVTRHTTGDPAFPPQRYTIAASPTLAVIFPVALTIRHAWVVSAEARGDPTLRWSAMGVSPCDVPAFDRATDVDPPTNAALAPTPSALYAPAVATPTPAPFEVADCDRAFAAATVLKPVQPVLTRTYMDEIPPDGYTAFVRVTLDPDGRLIDVSIYASSGYTAWDRAALRAAALSTYTGAVSYCRPVYGEYLFGANYRPR